jgi:hypothetical protein
MIYVILSYFINKCEHKSVTFEVVFVRATNSFLNSGNSIFKGLLGLSAGSPGLLCR